MGDQRVFADPLVGLAQLNAGFLSQPHQPLARPMRQLGVGRKGDRLGLHNSVDNDLGEIRWLGCAGARRNRQAFLNQARQALLPDPLAPARQRRAVEGQLVLEDLLAAEELAIGILDPARPQILVGEIMHVPEDQRPRHQPRWQRRLSDLVGIDRAEPLLEGSPVDRPTELRQRVVHVDDLVEPRLEEITLPAVPPLLGPHRITSAKPTGGTESRHRSDQFVRKQTHRRRILANAMTRRSALTRQKSGGPGFFAEG
jgi:hypothetical protein